MERDRRSSSRRNSTRALGQLAETRLLAWKKKASLWAAGACIHGSAPPAAHSEAFFFQDRQQASQLTGLPSARVLFVPAARASLVKLHGSRQEKIDEDGIIIRIMPLRSDVQQLVAAVDSVH